MSQQNYKHKSGAQKRFILKQKQKLRDEGKQTLQQLGFTVTNKVTSADGGDAKRRKTIDEDSSETLEIEHEPNLEIVNTDSLEETDEGTIFFDIGTYNSTQQQEALLKDPEPYPHEFPRDKDGSIFPTVLLKKKLESGSLIERDWLVWSRSKESFYCYPCRLFCELPENQRSSLSVLGGWGPEKGYHQLYSRIPDHERSVNHKMCYMKYRTAQKDLKNSESILKSFFEMQIETEAEKWKKLLKRFLDVILFIAERGLALRGSNQIIGDCGNGNFLGLLELLARYDPLLAEHLEKVKKSQYEKKRLQVSYLSPEIQNDFLSVCAGLVSKHICNEIITARYYSIICDGTPDQSHTEQNSFVVRFVSINEKTNEYNVYERFVTFIDSSAKTGLALANLIQEALNRFGIPLEDCRGQSYDNASNMSGCRKGCQARILELNPLAVYSSCGGHNLNLCGEDASGCCIQAVTFFGVIQKLYNIFSSSPHRWEILKKHTGVSLHSMSKTRWSARIECVRPVVKQTKGIINAINEVLTTNLKVEVRADLLGTKKYIRTFEFVVLAHIWFKILTQINYVSSILQAREITLDKEVVNLEVLLQDLEKIRSNWGAILAEAQEHAVESELETEFKETRLKKANPKYFKSVENVGKTEEDKFKEKVFLVILDTVTESIKNRFQVASKINSLFEVLWKFREFEDEKVIEKTRAIFNFYNSDISEDICDEILHLKAVFNANFECNFISPLSLLNQIHKLKVDSLFPNLVVILKIICTIPVTVCEAERSFSCLSRIKNEIRTTMSQDRLNNLAILCIESELARELDYSEVIEEFSNKKARKAVLV